MGDLELKNIIEVFLLSSPDPLELKEIQEIFNEDQRPTEEQIKAMIKCLKVDYATRSFDVIEGAKGYMVQTKKEYSHWVMRLNSKKPAKYSRALLEILAIIAYKQPVTRGDIEEIRGVGVNSTIIKILLEREWIRVAGHKDIPGKPAVYTTTKEFLSYFNLHHLNELPSLPVVLEKLIVDHTKEEWVTT